MDLDAERALRDRLIVEIAARLTETGGLLTRAELSAFPDGDGGHRRLVDQSRGIWNPRDLAATLSVVSRPAGPYDDRDDGGLFRYSYRRYADGSIDGDNLKLRRAMELALPLVLLRWVDHGLYLPVLPAWVVGDDRGRREFVLALDADVLDVSNPLAPTVAERRYARRITWERLHQPEFRARVLRAYAGRCTVCSLRHGPLLDAAHITGDTEERGDPVVTNGLTLCKIHHAAYDRNLMGISPDNVVRINGDLLEEIDGPMLQHGLKEMHDRPIRLPARRAERPDRDRLDARFQEFLAAG